jgi:excisionase family DNA binding protein
MSTKLFTIQQVADQLGVSTKTLRRWEEKGYIKAKRTSGNQRRYTEKNVERLKERVKRINASPLPSTPTEAKTISSASYLGTAFAQPDADYSNSLKAQYSNQAYPSSSYSSAQDTPKTEILPEIKPKFRLRSISVFLGVFVVGIVTTLIAAAGLFPELVAHITNPQPKFTNETADRLRNLGLAQVLADTIKLKGLEGEISFNVPSVFNKAVTINADLFVDGDATVSGTLTAPNITYRVLAGQNITVEGDPQNPTISTGPIVTSFAGQTGDLELEAGSGISINDLEISLTNTSITVTAGNGLAGGGTVALGGSVSLTNDGVTSITGTANQIIASSARGDITLSLPQDIDLSASPTFASLNLTNDTNQLVMGSTFTGTLSLGTLTDNRTYTLPDLTVSTDTLCVQLTGNCSGGAAGIGGTGTIGRVARFTAAQTIGDGSINDLGSAVAMTIDAAGNVGIGTTTPTTFKLETAGSIGPSSDNTYDLGSALRRWANIYGTNVIATNISGAITPTGFTQGSVTFAGVGGTLTQDNANFFWDDTNNRLGIGTTAPTQKLTVIGDASNTSVARFEQSNPSSFANITVANTAPGSNNNIAGLSMILNTDTSARTAFRIDSTFSNITDATRNSLIEFKSNNAGSFATAMTINGGNVGIGTTSPSALLSVGATSQFQVNSTGQVTYVDGATNTASLVCRNSSGQLAACNTTGTGAAFVQGGNSFGALATLGTNDNFGLAFETFGTERMRILTDGNVGIGTTTPSSFKLEVAGSIGPSVDNTYDLGSVSRRWANIYATNITGSITPTGFTQGSVAFAGTGGTLTQDNANFFWDDTNNRLGIGTTAPTSQIHLTGDSQQQIFIDTYSSTQAPTLSLRRSGGTTTSPSVLSSGSLLGRLSFRGYTGSAFSNNQASIDGISTEVWSATNRGSALLFLTTPNGSTSTSERMRIDSAGNVGIGTTTPTSKLDVNGTITATGITSSGTINFSGLTASSVVFTDASKNLVSSAASSVLATSLTDETGTGVAVFSISPTLTTPVLGVATATSINNVAFTTPATGATLTIADGKTLTVNGTTTLSDNSITFGGTEILTLAAAKNVTFADEFTTSGSFPLTLTTTGTTNATLPSGTITLADLTTAQTLTNKTFTDNVTWLQDQTDNSKKLQFDLVNIATATTLTLGVPTGAGSSDTVCLFTASNCVGTGGGGAIGGGGTLNFLAKFTPDGNNIGNSVVYDDGTNVGIGTTSPNYLFSVGTGSLFGVNSSGNIVWEGATADAFELTLAPADVGQDTTITIPDPGLASDFVCLRDLANCTGTGGSVAGTGTANRVAYWTAANTIAADNDFFFDGTNVGIGTTAPTNPFHVVSADGAVAVGRFDANAPAGFSNLIISNTATAATTNKSALQLSTNSDTTSRAALRIDASLNTVADATRNSLVLFNTNNAGSFATAMAINGGNIGIGTTAPDQPLHVVGTAIKTERFGGTPQLIASRTNGTSASPTIISNNSTLFALTGQGYDGTTYQNAAQVRIEVDGLPGLSDMPGRITFSTTADGAGTTTERMRIDSSGNVGIGTTAPSSFRLEVAGNVGPEADNTRDLGSTVRRWANIYGTNVIATNLSGAVTPTGFTQGSVAFAGSGGTLTQDNANFFWDDTNNRLGLGTTTPLQKLHLYESIDAATNLRVENPNTGTSAFASTNIVSSQGTLQLQSFGSGYTGAGGGLSALGGYGRVRADAALNGLIVEAGGAHPILLTTNNTERVRIDSSGNVGIGTTAPTYTLDINGTMRANSTVSLTGLSAGTGDALCRDGSNNVVTCTVGSGGVSTLGGTVNYIPKFTTTSEIGNSLIYDDGTNIGIGTTGPNEQLVVGDDFGNLTSDRAIVLGNSAGNTVFVQGTDANNWAAARWNNATKSFRFQTSNAGTIFTTMTMLDGNVGIGTVNPSSFKLEIAGNVGPEADNTRDLGSAVRRWANIYGTNVIATNLSGAVTPTGFTQGSVAFAGVGGTLTQDNANFFWDDTNNRLGIGTTSPTARLHVTTTNANGGNFVNTATSGATGGSRLTLYSDDGAAMASGDRLGLFLFGGSTDASSTLVNSAGFVGFADGAWTGTSSPSYITVETTPSGTTVRSEVARFTSAGNVGIGTTAPGAKLDILGTDTTVPAVRITAAGNTPTGDVFQIRNASSTTEIAARYVSGMPSGDLGLFVVGSSAFGGTAINPDILLIASRNITDPTSASTHGGHFSRNLVLTAANSNNVIGGQLNVSTSASAFNHTGILRGGYLTAQNANTATVSDMRGSESLLYNTSTGTITNGYAGYFNIQNLTTGTIGSAYGNFIRLNLNGGTITNTYGLYIDDVTLGTQTNQAYGIYVNDANARNYFAGNVGIGTTAPTGKLDVRGIGLFGTSDLSGIPGRLVVQDSTAAGNSLSLTTNSNIGSSVLGINFIDRINATSQGAEGQIGSYIRSERSGSGAGFRLLFGTSDGVDLAADAVTKMVIDTTGNVGIGTTAPGSALHVGAGSGATINSIIPQINNVQTSGQASIGVYVNDGTNNRRASFFVDQTNAKWGLFNTYGSGAIPFTISQGGTEVFRIDSSGNTGIGTTAPSALFSVGSTSQFQVNSSGQVTYVDGTTNTATAVCKNASGQLAACNTTGTGAAFVQGGNSFGALATLGTNDSFDLAFETAGVEKMRILTSGNVGIGTTTPLGKLEIKGGDLIASLTDNRITSTYGGFGGAFTNLIANPSFEGNSTSSWTTFGTNTIAADTAQSLHGSYSMKATYNNDLRLAAQGSTLSTSTTYTVSAYVYIPSDWDGGAITLADDSTFTGRTLTNYNADMTLTNQWQRVSATLTTAADGVGTIVIRAASAPTAGKFIYVDNVQITTGSSPLAFSSLTSAVPKGLSTIGDLTVMGLGNSYFAGNVGIGTTSPTALLQVSKAQDAITQLMVQNTAVGASARAYLSVNADSAQGVLQAFSSGSSVIPNTVMLNTSGSFPLLLGTVGAERMRIDTSGNVGIGTTAPTHKLEIVGGFGILQSNVATDATLKTSRIGVGHYTNAEEPFYWVTANGANGSNQLLLGGGTVLGNAATSIQFFTAANSITTTGTERMRIDSAGNVGIGITNPGAKLSVYGSGSTLPTARLEDGDITLPDYSGVGFDPALSVNTIGQLTNFSGSTGGIQLQGFTPSGQNAGTPVALIGYHGGTAPTTAAINLVGYKHNGTTGRAALANAELLLQISNGIGTPRFTIQGDGNVGIGTTAPSSFKLEVAGSVGPEADNTRDLGSASRRWANIYGTNFHGSITPTGFTQGSVVFAGSGGTLTQDNANFFWDDTNNRLGIGTTAPGHKLTVTGSQSDPASQTTAGYFTNTTTLTANNASEGVAHGLIADGRLNQDAFNSTAGLGLRGISAIARAQGTSGTITGQVGVLSVLSNTSTGTVTNAYGFYNNPYGNSGTLTNNYGFYAAATTAGTNIYGFHSNIAAAANRYNFYAAGTADNYFAGNVGIGTTTPGSKLTINQNMSGATDSVNEIVTLLNTAGTINNDAVSIRLNAGGGASGTFLTHQRQGSSGGDFYISTAPTLTGTSVERFRITKDGNVGIGTTAPGSLLHVRQSADSAVTGTAIALNIDSIGAAGELTAASGNQIFSRIAPVINQSGTAAAYGLEIYSTETALGSGGIFPLRVGSGSTSSIFVVRGGSSPQNLTVGGSASNPGIAGVADTNTGLYFNNSDLLSLVTNSQQRLTVDSTGNVGIGTTAPTGKLHVLGSEATATTALLVEGDGDSNDFLFKVRGQGDPTQAFTESHTRFVVDGNGNVGIGTTGPTALLNLGTGDFLMNGGRIGNTALRTDSWVAFSGNVPSSISGTTAAGIFVDPAFTTTQTTTQIGVESRVRQQAAGGATTVSNLKTFLADSPTLGTNWTATTTYGMHIRNQGLAGTTTTYGLFVDTQSGSTNNYSAIFQGGNVGIGTTAPGALLAVGTTSASNFKVNSDGDITSSFVTLNGSSTTSGAGTNSTSLVLVASGGTNFDVGNYVQVDPTGANTCSGTETVCYAKITAKSTDTLTISPALTWDTGAAVTEVHIPEVGGTNLAQALTNRYGRGYFIDGIVAGNTSTIYTDSSIQQSLASSTFNLLNNGNTSTINIGTSGTTVNIPGSFTTSGGNITITKADPTLIYDVTTAGDTDFWAGVTDDADGLDDDLYQIGKGTTPGTTPYLTINQAGNVGIGTTTPGAKLDIIGGNSAQLRLRNNDTDATSKNAYIQGGHFTNAEEDVTIAILNSLSTTNVLHIGGGSGAQNAVTAIRLYTAANNTTTTGTEAMRIDSSGNVGIGTTAPAALAGTTPVTMTIDDLQNGTWTVGGLSSQLAFNSQDISGTVGTRAKIASVMENAAGSLTGMALYTNDAANLNEVMRLSGTGNVGIGTTAPVSKLHVDEAGGTVMTLSRTAGLTSGTLGQLNFGNIDIDNQLALIRATQDGATDAGNLEFHTEATGGSLTQRMTITSGGNVGIGLTNPGNRLTVRASADSDGILLRESYAGNSFLFNVFQNVGDGTGATLAMGDGAGVTTISLTSGTGNSYFNGGGNIGIGTTAPTEKLQVHDSSDVQLRLVDDSALAAGIGGGISFAASQVTGGPFDTAKITAEKLNSTITDSSYDLAFWTKRNNVAIAERMRIDSNGNVGIGITAPTTYLDITGTNAGTTSLRLRSGDGVTVPADSNQILFSYNGTTSYTHAIKTRHNSGAAINNAIDFYLWDQTTDAAGTIGTKHVLTLEGTGNVGIGTSAPSALLSVGSTSQFQVNSSGQVTYVDGTTNTATAVCKNASGQLAACNTTGTGAAFVQGGNSFGALATLGTNDSFDLAFETAGVEKMRILTGGNVGIGTTAPGALLSVGTTTASNFKVNSLGDVTSSFVTLNGSTTANGAGTNSTTLVLALGGGANFDVGNYVQVDPTGAGTCSGTETVCYAKITAKSTDTLTISPALTWDTGAAIVEVHVPEVGGTNLAQTLTNRYGRGYFIDGIVTGNGSTSYTDSSIQQSLAGSTFNLLNNGNTSTINIGTSGTTVNIPGSFTTSGGNITITKADPALIYDVTTAGDTDFWAGVTDDAGGDNDDLYQIGLGTTPGTTPYLTINQGGNVGIGTTAPLNKLNVASAVTATDFSTPVAQFTGTSYTAGGFYGIGFNFANGSAVSPVALGYIPTVGAGNAKGALVFATRDTTGFGDIPLERMRIDSAGNVGIGTTLPQAKLSLGSDLTAQKLLIYDSANTRYGMGLQSFELRTFAGTGGVMTFGHVSTSDGTTYSEKVRIDASGNVGIGTTAPGSLLQVRQSADSAVTGTAVALNIDSIGAAGELTAASGNQIFSRIAPTINQSGTATAYGLEIYSTETAVGSGGVFPLRVGSGSTSSILVVRGGSSPQNLITGGSVSNPGLAAVSDTNTGLYFNNSDLLSLVTNSQQRLTIDSTGNVGIGITNPGSKLTVGGGDLTIDRNSVANTGNLYLKSGTSYASDGRTASISIPSSLAGRIINRNADMLDGTTGYAVYNNAGGAKVTISSVADSAAPNSSGKSMRVSYDGTGTPSVDPTPGFGGFRVTLSRCTGTNNAVNGYCYREGNRYVHRIWAKIPSGRTLIFASNATGTGASHAPINSWTGTGNWESYEAIQTIGTGGTFSSTGFWYITGGTNAAFDWDVAYVGITGVDEGPSVLATTSLNVGYLQDANLDYGQFLTTGASYLAVSGGNVGIGTTAPGAKLDVQSVAASVFNTTTTKTGSSGPIFGIRRARPSAAAIIANDVMGDLNFQGSYDGGTNFITGARILAEATGTFSVSSAPTRLSFYTNPVSSITAAERMRIDENGNVGIGTTAPNGKLEVAGSASTASTILASLSSASTGLTTDHNTLSLINTDATANNYVKLGFSDNANGTNNAAAIYGVFTDHTNDYGDIAFLTRSASGFTEKMRILAGGNVGIGTTAPGVNLDIRSSGANAHAWLSVGNSSSSNFLGLYGGRTNDDYSSIYWESSSDSLRFGTATDTSRTSFSEKMRITSDGNVGIGITNPTHKLSVVESTASTIASSLLYHSDNTSAASHARHLILTGGASGGDPFTRYAVNGVIDWSVGIDNSDSDKFKISQNSALGTNDFFTLQTDGNVGIGITAPGAALSIQGANGLLAIGNEAVPTTAKIAEIYQGYSGSSDAYGLKLLRYQTTNANTNLYGIFSEAQAFNLGTNTLTNAYGIYTIARQSGTGTITNAYSLYSASPTGTVTNGWNIYASGTAPSYFGGNVGIGTTAPGSLLEVGGKLSVTGAYAATVGQNGLHFGFGSNAGKIIAIQEGTAYRNLNIDGANLLLQTGSGGNVGIGTTAPAYKLAVTGSQSDPITQSAAGYFTNTTTLTAANAIEGVATGLIVDGQLNQGAFNSTATYGLRGVSAIARAQGASGTITGQVGVLSVLSNVGAGTVTNAYGFYNNPYANSGGGTVTNYYGYHTGAQAIGTNIYGFYGNIAAAANRYNFYAAGTADNYFAGNVGIGTTAPGALLHVSQTSTAVSGTNTNTQSTLTANPGSAPVAGTSYRAGLFQGIITTGNAQDLSNVTLYGLMGQTSTGHTSTLTSALGASIALSANVAHINSGTITSALGISSIVNNTSTGTITNATGLSIASTLNSGGGTIVSNLGILVGAQTAGGNNAGIVIGEATGTNQSNLVIGQTTIPTGTYSIYNSSPDQNYFAGNVGIGTTGPTEKLQVSGGIYAGGYNGTAANSVAAVRIGRYTVGGYGFIQAPTNEALNIWNPNSNLVATFGFAGAPTDVRTSFFGNVGIGTTAPAGGLHVRNKGITSLILQDSGDTPIIQFRNNADTDYSSLGFLSGGLALSGSAVATTDTHIFIANGGNVGIGTTAPNRKLELYQTDSSAALLRLSSKDSVAGSPPEAALEFFGSSTTDASTVYSAGRIYSVWDGSTYSTTRLTLQSASGAGTYTDTLSIKNGNVGIGTTTPTNGKLEVVQTSDTSSGGITVRNTSLGGSLRSWVNSSSVGILDSGASGTAFLTLNSGGGNVGIGTTGPTGKLQITGTSDQNQLLIVPNATQTTNTLAVQMAGTANLGFAVSGAGHASFTSPILTNSILAIGSTGYGGFSSASQTYGVFATVPNGGLGNITGVFGQPVSTAAGTVGSLVGVQGSLRTANAGLTLTAGKMFEALSPTVSSGTITNQYGLYINQQDVTGVGTGYGVYQTSSADLNYFAGNVGIGTTNPQAKLEISGGSLVVPATTTSTIQGLAFKEGSTNIANFQALDLSGVSYAFISTNRTYGTGGWSASGWHGSRTAGSLQLNDDVLNFYQFAGSSNTPTEAFRIAAGGNVGIGTAAPAGLLDISKSISAAPSAVGKYLSISASTLTDSSTAASGSTAANYFNTIAAPTLAATNTTVSTTLASTFSILGAPIKGTNNTATLTAALHVGSVNVGAQTASTAIYAQAQSGATNNYAAIFTGGNVGIGTAAPAKTLDVAGELQINLASTQTTAALCGTQGNGGGATANDVTVVDCSAIPAADYMEMYSVEDGLEMGDIVMPSSTFITTKDGESISKLTRSSSSYQSGVIGIVSDKSKAGDFNSIGYNIKDEDNPQPVALSGRVPVKVATDSAAIKAGDYITSSSQPGRAMKATSAGQMIGKALEDWDPTSGKQTVMVFVTTSYGDPNNALASLSFDQYGNLILPQISPEDEVTALGGSTVPSAGSGQAVKRDLGWNLADIVRRLTKLEESVTASGSAAVSNNATDSARLDILEGNVETNTSDISNLGTKSQELTTRIASLEADLLLFASASASLSTSYHASSAAELSLDTLDAKDVSITNTLSVGGRTTLSDVGITGKMNIGLLSIEGLSENGFATLNTVSGPLMIQSDGINGVDILNGKVVIAANGDITTKGEITTKKINIDTTQVAGASLGTATILNGQTKITVNTTAITDKSKIFVQAIDAPVATAVKRVDADTFEIRIALPQTTDLKLNWWIVN